MRLLPRSLFGRLLVAALVATAAALIFAAFAIGNILERFVTHGLDDRLDAQIFVLERAVRPDGMLDPTRAPAIPPFDVSGSGWAWEIRAPSATLRSDPSVNITPDDDDPPPPPEGYHDPYRPRPFETRDGERGWVHGRMLIISTPRGDVRILATGPRDMVERPLHAAMVPLLFSLLLLGAAMAIAILIQLRVGLRPLTALRTALAEVRAGQREHVEVSEPAELLPLVDELNALIDANRVSLAQARGHVANLAHGLKTPLAGLRLDLAAVDTDGNLTRQIDRIDAHVRHHLGRARAAMGGGAHNVATPLAAHVNDLVAVLQRIHADRAIEVEVAIPSPLTVRCDPQDLDEMLGNLLDNAWKWANSKIVVSSQVSGRETIIRITDDGPGLSADQIARATDPGWRLDETSAGHGFGLTIVRELAELHGGQLTLQNGSSCGLIAELRVR